MNNDTKGFIVCKHCGYNTNPITSTHCLKCGQTLDFSVTNSSDEYAKLKPNSLGDWLFTPWMIWLGCGLLFVLASWSIYSLFGTSSSVNNSTGVGVYSSGDSTQNIPPDVILYDSIKDVPKVPEGTFNYGGGSTFAALTAQGFHQAIATEHPNFRLRFTEPKDGKSGGKKGVAMLLDSQLSFTLIGAPLGESDYEKAKQRGFQLKQVPIALDILVFFTHPDIKIPGLSVDQVQDIYKGKLTNWKEVGGPDLPIVPFTRDPEASNLVNGFLGQEFDQISSRVQIVTNYTEALRKVYTTPGSISLAGNAPIVGQQTINSLPIARANSQEYVQPFMDDGKRINAAAIRDGSYPISRRLFIVYRQDGTIDQLVGEAYTNMLLSKEGQEIVEKAGLVPIR